MKKAFLTEKEIANMANALARYKNHEGEWADDLFDVDNGDWFEKMMKGHMKINTLEYCVFEKVRDTSFEEKIICKDGYEFNTNMRLQYSDITYTRNGKEEHYIQLDRIERWMRFVEINAMMRLIKINWG